MTEPERKVEPRRGVRTPNWTTIALVGGLLVLVLLVAYFATSRNADQDKLTGDEIALNQAAARNPEKLCASKATYDLIKRDLFRRAAQLRGSDQAAYDKISASASLRMENPVMENEDSSTGAVHCSGSLSIDLPPGIVAVGGRRTLSANVDYTIQPAADGSGNVVLLHNADTIIAPLATLARATQPATEPAPEDANDTDAIGQPEIDVDQSESANQPVGPQTSYPGRPSFDCGNAATKGEIAVCSDSGLSALDVNMANQYRRALSSASPEQQALLRRTRDRFLAYRDRCPNRSCIGDAYVGRMREIRDIMEGRWSPAER
jgi:hypothetical protein